MRGSLSFLLIRYLSRQLGVYLISGRGVKTTQIGEWYSEPAWAARTTGPTEQRKIPAGMPSKLLTHTMEGKQANKVSKSYPAQNKPNDSPPMPRPQGTYRTEAAIANVPLARTPTPAEERRESP